jgi:hypothetical protein
LADHFVGANEMVDIGSGAQRNVPDVHLTRYGCYLVAMNGDPRKPEIAAAQNYFAVMTCTAEVNGFAQPAAPDQDPILAMLEACRDKRRAQLALEGRVDAIQQQVSNLVGLRTAALRVLTDVPRADEPAAPLSVRARVNMLVRTYIAAHGVEY